MGESIPPAFLSPTSSSADTDIDILVFTQKEWPIEIKDVEK
jgi:hypothetical protein